MNKNGYQNLSIGDLKNYIRDWEKGKLVGDLGKGDTLKVIF